MNKNDINYHLLGLRSILNNWYAYCDLHLTGRNEQKYRPDIVTNFRTQLQEECEELYCDFPIMKTLCDELLHCNRNDFSGIKNVMENYLSRLNNIFRKNLYNHNF